MNKLVLSTNANVCCVQNLLCLPFADVLFLLRFCCCFFPGGGETDRFLRSEL